MRAIAAPSASLSTIAWISPSLSASAAGIGLPDVTSRTAVGKSTRRISRCVPLAPGTSPIFTSGKPTAVPASAIRARAASAISKPPPNALPCSAAAMGLREWAMAAITSGSCGSSSGRSISRISAPAMKVRPAVAITAPDTAGSVFMAAIAAISPARIGVDSACTGGLSTVMTAVRPRMSVVTDGMAMAFRKSLIAQMESSCPQLSSGVPPPGVPGRRDPINTSGL
jgi:hypothetical protein